MEREEVNDGECQFRIFPLLSASLSHGEVLNDISLRISKIRKEVDTLSSLYFWHNDRFIIDVKNLTNDIDPVCFYGTLNFAENIEDEWFLVYVLIELSKRFDDLVISVVDSDGEFLLIEAADHLPAWVSPETCEGRVFIHKGNLHILPQTFLPIAEDDETPFKVTSEVLDFIRQNPNSSIVDSKAQKLIMERINSYPDQIASTMHQCVLNIPVAVAFILEKNAKLVTAAVKAFCDRDLIDLKACRAMKYLPPEECVLSQVKFTKCSYAMLFSSKYQPDKRTGWRVPPASDPAYKANILGIKLACGFEILMTQIKGAKKVEDSGNLSEDRGWLKMLARLNEVNYFRGLLPHSKQYNELLNTAQNFYRQNCTTSASKNVGARAELALLMESLDVDADELKRKGAAFDVTDNDDSWMDVSQTDLEQMLTQRFGNIKPTENSNEIAKHLNSFLNHPSAIEGVEYPNQAGSSLGEPARPPRSAKNKKRKSVQFSEDTKDQTKGHQSDKGKEPVSIDPDGFMQAVKNILDFSIPDDNYWGESDGSEMSSYEDEDDDLELGDTPPDAKMKEYFKRMEKELDSTTLGQSFIKNTKGKGERNTDEKFEDVEDFEPVDIDMNALKNILMSYKTQMGEAGPAENLLGPMGVNLRDIDADVD